MPGSAQDNELTRLFARAFLAVPHGERSAACRQLAEQALRGLAMVRSDAEAADAARDLVCLFDGRAGKRAAA